jgi:hypothetical protein
VSNEPTTAVDEKAFGAVLGDATAALAAAEIPYLLVGGLASTVCGRSRWTADIDFLVREGEADRVLEALAGTGFETERTNPMWIFKAFRDDIVIDVIFWMKGNIVLDDEMLARSVEADVMGAHVRVAAPEDLLVMKAIANDEQSPRHWGDALALIGACELDWEYLVRRARLGPLRVLALLVYAESDDLLVPHDVIRTLHSQLYGSGE